VASRAPAKKAARAARRASTTTPDTVPGALPAWLSAAPLDQLALTVEASLLSEDLYEFAKACWHVIEPGAVFRDNWHLRVLCDHLMAVSLRQIRDLIINIPPRSMKSLLVSVIWPAWQWTWQPTHKWLFSSYGQSLATRDALKTRRLIQSKWYQTRWGENSGWPHAYRLTGDQNQKMRYENDRLGYRISTSVGGLGTGEGGDTVVVDDPHNVEQAESEAVRESTLTWWDETMSTRGNDPSTVARVIVMQRVHERDLTAHCLAKGGYEHLCLPMEFERDHPTRSATSLGFKDPRRAEGELLWPGRFTPGSLTKLKISLGEYGVAGQLQQRPAPRGGGMFKLKHIQLWPKDKLFPGLLYVVQSYDTAFTDKTANDPTACTVWGVWETKDGERNTLLLDAWDDHLRYAALRKRVVADWRAKYGQTDADPTNPGRRADEVLVEAKGSGISIIQDLQAARVPARSYNPGRADKTARGEQCLPLYELGTLWVPESSHPDKADPTYGHFASWARPFVRQLCTFGPGVTAHDDYVDTYTQATLLLRDQDWLTLPQVDADEPAPSLYARQKRNPYD